MDMPLIFCKNSQISALEFRSTTKFKAGKLGDSCNLKLIYGPSQLDDPEFKSIDSYIGGLLDAVFHGEGKLIYTNGDEYNGLFSHGRKEGTGVYNSKSTGDDYHGGWKEDLFDGDCKIAFGTETNRNPVNIGAFKLGINNYVGDSI